jgi:ribosomal protein S19E (S16A)
MYKALKSFSGLVTMAENDIKEIKDEKIVKDLLKAGYIEKVKDETKNIKKDIENVVDKVEEEIKKVSKKAKK